MTTQHHNFASASIRAQDLMNGHIARIDAALRHLRLRGPSLISHRHEAMSDKLDRLRSALVRDLDAVLACPSIAKHYNGKWGGNLYGPNVMDACEAVDRAATRDETVAAYRRSVMRAVR